MCPSKRAGFFIVVDGIDGAGKSTQIARLSKIFSSSTRELVVSREPTDGKWGRMIRESATKGRLSAEDELQAFLEDRRDHCQRLIRPSLESGCIVLIDRYLYSTVAYQGLRDSSHRPSNGLSALQSDLLDSMRSEFPTPDITFFFDLPVSLALQRIRQCRGDTPNEFEQESALTAIRNCFSSMTQICPETELVDCSGDADSVTKTLMASLRESALVQRCCKIPLEDDPLYQMLLDTSGLTT